jgi:flagellar biosynthesis protein FlhA
MNRHDDGKLHVLTLAPALEAQLKGSLASTERGLGLQLEASTAQQLVRKTGEEMEKMAGQGYQPILLCAREVRLALRRFVERVLPNLVVIAFSEVTSGVPVQAHGVVEV